MPAPSTSPSFVAPRPPSQTSPGSWTPSASSTDSPPRTRSDRPPPSLSPTRSARLLPLPALGTHLEQENDSSYSATVSIGTPYVPLLLRRIDSPSSAPQRSAFQPHYRYRHVFASVCCPASSHPPLGSADLWVATTQCTTCSSDVPLFNPSESSSFKNGSSSVKISYGSGSVRGYVSQDTVNFAGFSIANQPLRASLCSSYYLLLTSHQSRSQPSHPT